MARIVEINEATRHLSRLLRQVQAGDEVVLARDNVPIARLVPVALATKRNLGRDRGLFTIPDDFNATLGPES